MVVTPVSVLQFIPSTSMPKQRAEKRSHVEAFGETETVVQDQDEVGHNFVLSSCLVTQLAMNACTIVRKVGIN